MNPDDANCMKIQCTKLPANIGCLMCCFSLQALDEQEGVLRQQIEQLDKQVKESTPDKNKLKQLQDSVKSHEKGNVLESTLACSL